MRERLKELLFERAKGKARELGLDLTEDTERNIRNLIDIAVDRMTFNEASSVVENTRALMNTDVLIERLAKSQYGNTLDYKSFNGIRDAICPLWPFC
ncbi:hypothetical protein ASG31_16705 [Chryseobacterium sp. Leaf404]|uniref:hypothetical protein n=1 Tax=unclassified Chryseobacterium TaxID=2593645 RepID=UPI0006F41AD1|nr:MULTISPECIES: hypothetical protein [unclassified Chryseobacterium]KQT20826.1 hypothetical protein ASG31_16705 [Chryseobacterium sp. Leaf404]